jgi:hypothetical protein
MFVLLVAGIGSKVINTGRHRNDGTKELLYLIYTRNWLPEKENSMMMYHD